MGSQSGSPSRSRVQVGAVAAFVLFSLVVATAGGVLEGQEIFSGEVCVFEPVSPCSSCSYRWVASDGSPLSSDSMVFNWTSPSVRESKTVIINLTVTNEDCCSGQGEMEVVVSPVPETPVCPVCAIVSKDVVCAGSTIGMETAEDPDYRYLWEASDGVFSSSNTSTTNWTAPDEPGEYTIHLLVSSATFDCSCGTSKVITVITCKPEIQVVKDCVYEPPVRVGDSVTYTYEVENVGDLPLRVVNLTDTHDWGPSCNPTLVVGDSGDDGVMDPGEVWRYECVYQIPNPSDYDQLLTVMAAPRPGVDEALIARLSRMTRRLEIKLESMIEMRGRFNFSRAQMTEGEIFLYDKNLTHQNYTDTVTKETLSLATDEAGVVRWSEYYSPIQDAVLTREWSPSGKLTSDFYLSRRTNEGLRIEYDAPTTGYKTYTVTDYDTGDTLITVMNAAGAVISREYRRTPGYPPYKKRVWVHNTATVTAIGPGGEIVTDEDVFSLEVELPQPDLKIAKRADPDPVEAGGLLKYTIDYANDGDAAATGVVIKETYDDNATFVSSAPTPDPGTDDIWTIGDLPREVSGSIVIFVRVNSNLESGSTLANRVNITSADNATDEAVVETRVTAPALVVEKVDDPDPVDVGGLLNYTIRYRNEGDGIATGVVVRESYDENVIFINSSPISDGGTNDLWKVGNLSAGEGGTIQIRVRVSDDVEDGTILNNSVWVTCDENRTANVTINTTVKGPRLRITKTAPSLASPNSTFNYTITFWNEGTGNATNVTVTDILDPNVDFRNSTSTPSDIENNTEDGWPNLWWNFEDLAPNETGIIEIEVWVKDKNNLSSDLIRNRYKIDSNESRGEFAEVRTLIVSSLWIRKTAAKSEYSSGEEVVYTILYGNSMNCSDPGNVSDCTAEDVVVVDRLPDLAEYLSASPPPSRAGGKILVWDIGNLSSNETGSINITVRIPERPDVRFDESSSVSGEGFVSVREWLSTSRKPYDLTNRANITGIYRYGSDTDEEVANITVHDSSEATINVVEALGTEISAVEHGSGYYEEERIARLNSTNKSTSIEKEIFAARRPTTFSLLNGRTIEYNSSWTDRTCAKNRIRSESAGEDYRYVETIDKRSSFLLDEDQTVYRSDSEFSGGMGSVGFLRIDTETGDLLISIDENYHGSFRVEESIDSYGSGVSYEKGTIGEGFVSADQRVDDSQRAFEHGSGHYESDELISTGTIYRDARMVYLPTVTTAGSLVLNSSSRWHEGISTRGDEHLISERTSSADYIDMETVADSSSVSIFGEFEGKQDVRAVVEGGPHEEEKVVIDQTFLGRYQVATSIGIYKAPTYLEPHVNVTKEQVAEGEDAVQFRINVTNDGNKLLGPVVVADLLPSGLVFINSSLRPEAEEGGLNWTILSLPMGGMVTIEVWAGILKAGAAGKNVVTVVAYYDGGEVTAEDDCVVAPPGLHLRPEPPIELENDTEAEENASEICEPWSLPDWNLTIGGSYMEMEDPENVLVCERLSRL
jgi:uncharacterized repeat protein (TIGR01451 family)